MGDAEVYINRNFTFAAMKRIAVFASGTGSNARCLLDYFRNSGEAEVALIVCNNPKAGVLQLAAETQTETLLLERERFSAGDAYVPVLQEKQIDFIVLAGFLWLVPEKLVRAYPDKIINIHPALLPKFGGKGMYGMHVHRAVIAAGETESGITIHYVNEHYDEGRYIAQVTCPVYATDTPEALAKRIQALEHAYLPETVLNVIGK